jgi:hypothetical protein
VRRGAAWGIAWLALLALAVCPAAFADAGSVLYSSGRGTLPDAQGWAYLEQFGSASRSFDGAAVLDTTSAPAVRAGYAADAAHRWGGSAAVPALDRRAGYVVRFAAQVEQEQHAGSDDDRDGVDDRAGFSVIVLSSDGIGIELGFWRHEVWAQEGGTGAKLFTHAEGAPLDTAAGLIDYALAVQGDTYALSAGGQPILAGKLRDYRAFFDDWYDPYETPSFLFFGDNTSRARARWRLGYVAVSASATFPAPLPTPAPQPAKQFIPLAVRP